ncbi:helix-turn-helix transcriptional regulator [Chryseobacterium echinoideorum]|uniref:helix-turn-helix transcriptional regulator n=1 Tax=Chryseobacterium echinoideorum TaxID=1549648 RepID=UPI0011867BB5|nr:hypothetical protein [Chryseobacterium echinoideorum]
MILLAISITGNCQQKNSKNVDSLLRLSELSRYEDGIKSLRYAKNAYDISEELNDNTLIIKSTISLAYQLFILDNYKESLSQISNLEKRMTVDDNILKTKILEVKYVNYNVLGLDDLALDALNKYISILEKIPTAAAKQDLVKGYFYYAYRFEKDKNYRMANQYIDKALKIGKTIRLNEAMNTYIRKSYISMGLKQYDSAKVYMSKAFEEARTFENVTYRYVAYELEGYYFFNTKDYQKSIRAFQKTLSEIESMKLEDISCVMDTSAKLADIYSLLGNKEEEKKYREKSEKYSNQLKEKKNDGLKETINSILHDQEKKNEKIETKNKWIAFLILFLTILGLFFYFIIKKTRQKKDTVLQQKEILLIEKSELEKQRDRLNRKAEESQLATLIDLAKNNSPEFIVLFQEMYPNFIKNIKSLNAKVSNSELHFLGLAFLNFSTKEIADITFVTIAAVQLRKHRIRKKYNIPSDKDFNIWIQERDNF